MKLSKETIDCVLIVRVLLRTSIILSCFCALYAKIRSTYIPNYYITLAYVQQFYNFMFCTNAKAIRNVAMFIYYAFNERKAIC